MGGRWRRLRSDWIDRNGQSPVCCTEGWKTCETTWQRDLGKVEMANPSEKDRMTTDERLHDLIAEYHDRVDQGETLEPAAFVSEHPDLETELSRYFDNVATLESLAGPTASQIQNDPTATVIAGETHDGAFNETMIENSRSGNAVRISNDAPLTQFGRYRITKELGRGAMGAVYLAHDQQLDREIALKIPKFDSEMNADLLERFYREARAAAALQHPGICPVFDVGELDGQHYITMGFIKGRPLRDFTKSSKRQEGKQVARVIRKIALAMAEAHEHNVTHRDLKPANIMINQKNEPVVMDFGLARRSAEGEEQLTHTGTVIGTPAYMSPEQVEGDNAHVGPAADIYSLGVIFYELLTGQLPFQGNLMSILRQISMDNPRPPVELHSDTDPTLQALCLRMLAKQASDRPESMQQVAKELSDWLQGGHAQTDESGVLETSRVPGQSKKKMADALEATDAMTTPGSPRTEPTPEEFPNVVDPHPVAAAEMSATTVTPSRASSTGVGPPTKNRKLLMFGGLGGAAILLAGIVFFLNLGGKYDVQITVDDPAISLKVDGDDVLIDGAGSQIRLSAGVHTLRMERDGLEAEIEEFTVRKDGKNVVHVAVIDEKLALLNEKQSPEPDVEKSRLQSPELPPAEYALSFDPEEKSHIVIPTLRASANGPLTIECWATPARENLMAALVRLYGEPGCSLFQESNKWSCARFESDGQHITGRAKLESDSRVHLAATWHDGSMTLFVDGRKAGDQKQSHMNHVPDRIQGLYLGGQLDRAQQSPAFIWAGTLEEVRVSNIVRYDADFTPVNRHQTDKNTLALYHFDEGQGDVLNDASGNGHHGKIVGAKWVKVEDTKQVGSLDTPAQLGADNALAFVDNTIFVHCPGVVIDQRGPYTVEAWIRDENRRGNLLSMRNGDFPRFIGGGLDHGLVLDVAKYKGVGVADKPIPQTGEWAHVAGVYADGEVRLYVDGELIGSKAVPPVDEMGSATDMNIGGRIHGSNSFGAFKGQIDEVRISNTTRYTDNFTPSRRYDSDEHTLALYHFDEGTGDILEDSSGNGHDGKIIEAKWVKAGGDTPAGPPDYAPLATGEWVRVFEVDPPPGGEDGLRFEDGVLVLDDATWTTSRFSGRDMLLRAKIRYESGQNAGVRLRYRSESEYVAGWQHMAKNFGIGRMSKNEYEGLGMTNLSDGSVPTDADGFVELVLATIGDRVELYAGGRKLLNATTREQQSGGLGLNAYKGRATFKDVEVMLLAELSSPAKTPPPAVAPFDEAKAQAHQQAWAKHLGEPVVTTNSLGMQLALIPPGRYGMGEAGVPVTLTRSFRMGVHEVTMKQWKAVMGTVNPQASWAKNAGDDAPITYVGWDQTVEFCVKLTGRERAAGKLPEGWEYRLPTEAEWEFACRAGTVSAYSFGDDAAALDEYGWYSGNSRPGKDQVQRRVGEKMPNPWGLYDMHGNVAEYCSDWYADSPTGGVDPRGPDAGTHRVERGGSYYVAGEACRSDSRKTRLPTGGSSAEGFRVVLAAVSQTLAVYRDSPEPRIPGKAVPQTEINSGDATSHAVAPFDDAQAKAHQQAWAKHLGEPVVTTNSVGMQLAVVPPGRFTMRNFKTKAEVTLTKPFRVGVHEVTQGQWKVVTGTQPWQGEDVREGENVPAVRMSWNMAVDFCRQLTERERTAGILRPGWEYRLPTEAEWAFACRAGTTTAYSFGDDESKLGDYAWFSGNTEAADEANPHDVGLKKPNAWGLHDVHGNVWEWCHDRMSPELPSGVDPVGPSDGQQRITRGGACNNNTWVCRSESRNSGKAFIGVGFRVALCRTGLPAPAVVPFDAAAANVDAGQKT
jgi:formylglycine-generating enzyme required for sulfatase activity/serine/threonine protein kinase